MADKSAPKLVQVLIGVAKLVGGEDELCRRLNVARLEYELWIHHQAPIPTWVAATLTEIMIDENRKSVGAAKAHKSSSDAE